MKKLDEAKIYIGWKILHKLVWWNELSVFFGNFLEIIGINPQYNEETLREIKKFQENKSWIIILNHPNSNFSDYIPLLSKFSEDKLKKTSFFAISRTTPMFKKEFWSEYDFVSATTNNFKEAKDLLGTLKKRIEKIKKEEGFIFIIPWWWEENWQSWWKKSSLNSDYKPFKSLFIRMIKSLDEDTPILVAHIKYDGAIWYWEIYKRLIFQILWFAPNNELTPLLQAKNLKSWDFKDLNPEEMSKYYSSLFN